MGHKLIARGHLVIDFARSKPMNIYIQEKVIKRDILKGPGLTLQNLQQVLQM